MTTLRCVALSLRTEMARTATLEAFVAAVDDLVDRLVEIQAHGPTLVTFPEHTGLLAAFVGPRGQAARDALAAGGSAVDALGALADGHPEALGHYAAAHPDVTSLGQLLHLALTDRVVRVLYAAFGGLARRRGLWVTVGAALPRWERVTDARVAAVTDGDGDGYAYVATGPDVRNRNLVFAPDGALVAVHDKAYLVPMERDEVDGLGLRACGLGEIEVAQLPFGRLGTVISKDAWMPDVNERLDQLGAQVLVQPEAFDRWGRADEDAGVRDLWPPDKFQRGGWWMLQRHPAFRVNVTPMLVGNLGDLAFDGQPLVAVPAPDGVPDLGLLGQAPGPGWAAVGGWNHLEDPSAALADPARRPAFMEVAAAMAPGSGDVLEGAVAETVAQADVRLPPRPTRHPELETAPGTGRSVEVARGGTQLVPRLVAHAGWAHLTWIDCDGPAQQVRVASGDGVRWSDPADVAPLPPRVSDQFHRQWSPRLVGVADGLVCAYLGFPEESWDVFAATSDGAGWQPPVRVDDADRSTGVLRERGHDTPVLVGDGDRLVATWSDLRWPWVLPQVRTATSRDGGRSWSSTRRVDAGPTDPGPVDTATGRHRGESRGQTAPAVAAVDGGVLMAWQEPTSPQGAPGIWCARIGADGSATPPGRLTDPGVAAYRPALAARDGRAWLVAEQADSQGGSGLLLQVCADGRRFTPAGMVDPDRPRGVVQRRAVAAGIAQGAVVVFEDDRAGVARVAVVVVTAEGPGTVRRVDDAPPGAHARAPAAAILGEELVVVWQDTRDGREQLRSTRMPLSELASS